MAALTLDLTGQPSGWAAVLTAGAVPQAAFMLLGGVATDRFRPRTVMLVGHLAPTVAIALPLLVIAGLCNMLAGMIFLVLLQTRPPEAVRGRVISLLLFGVFGLSPLWYTVAGFLGDALGPRWLVVAGGGVSLLAGLVGAATWLRLPADPVTT